jgi:hypothetical protein
MMGRPYPFELSRSAEPEFVAMAIWLTVQKSLQRCGSCRSIGLIKMLMSVYGT